MKRFLFAICLLSAMAVAQAPKKPKVSWYKFSKIFITEHYSKDSAIGELEASAVFPNKRVHKISCAGNFSSAFSIRSMNGFQGYGASKFKPMLLSIKQEKWLHVFEDGDFVYVQLQKAENFYQLPVKVKTVQNVSGGIEATVDVFSDQ